MRNLDDEQLKALKSVDGLLGLVGYSVFVRDEDSNEDLKELYLKHIEKAISIIVSFGCLRDKIIEIIKDTFNDNIVIRILR